MRFISLFLLFVCLLAAAAGLRAQPNHRLTAFHGTIYEMPAYSETKGFKLGLEPFDSVGHIVLPELNFLPAYPAVNFPDRNLTDRFAFALDAVLTVAEEACYRLTLVSDDGSKLWVDDALSVDNDGMHPWRIMRDTLLLTTGKHDLRLWYYNAVGPCGLALKLDVVDSVFCAVPLPEPVACITFAENRHALGEEAKRIIETFAAELKPDDRRSVSVVGYADVTGAAADNDALSLRRARSVADYLRELTGLGADSISVSGKGEVENLADIEEHCQSDRAVTIRLLQP